jgi:hypothetical protein
MEKPGNPLPLPTASPLIKYCKWQKANPGISGSVHLAGLVALLLQKAVKALSGSIPSDLNP